MNSSIQNPEKSLSISQCKDNHFNKTKADLMNDWKREFTERIQSASNSRKEHFTFNDACQKINYHTKRDQIFLSVVSFLRNEPLKNNDYVKYVTAYITTGIKLNPKYFKNNLNKLEEYYKKVDEARANGKEFNPFSIKAYERYVLYMVLKLSSEYTQDFDDAFGVQTVDNREYNPLTNIPSVLRGELPFEVIEYDIKRAFPTFIDIELNTDHRFTIYDILDKKTFACLLNSNNTNKGVLRKTILKELSKVYGNNADKVYTVKRFKTKGAAFMDFSKYEKEYIERFVSENSLVHYVRLHDGVFVLKDTECNITKFDKVDFSIKDCIKTQIENKTVNFYKIDEANKVYTSPKMYSDFFIQENFLRISTPDDKLLLLRDTNNVVSFFNHNTDTVSFLKEHINEFGNSFDAVADTIARENFSTIKQGFLLITPIELTYHSDTKNTFGLPFKNGFFEFNGVTNQITKKEYTDVNGFFSPHGIQSRTFEYTDEVGMFEYFFIRSSIGQREIRNNDHLSIVESFMTMFGYLCHNYKDMTNNPSIVLTDMDADGETRNGRRGKTLITKAIQEVQVAIIKGGKEFDSGYTFVFDDLERKHKVYIIDDVPSGFKYDDLYTNILGDISCQRKGQKAELIKFEDAPKFLITSNWVVSYDEKNASTNARFIEFKFTNYYNKNHSPKDEFGCAFFEDWDPNEWNRFYSFVFRCVILYLQKGIIKVEYNKADDNYKSYFNNDAVYSEFHRCINKFIIDDTCLEFSVSDFLREYNNFENPLRFEKMFTTKNAKRFIDAWISKFNTEKQGFCIEYSKRKRIWIKKY